MRDQAGSSCMVAKLHSPHGHKCHKTMLCTSTGDDMLLTQPLLSCVGLFDHNSKQLMPLMQLAPPPFLPEPAI
jgi:hypothetical protein